MRGLRRVFTGLALCATGASAGPYDGVVSRAFAPPPDALAHAQRLLRPGGLCVLFLQAGATVPAPEGWQVIDTVPYVVGSKARKAVTLRWQP